MWRTFGGVIALESGSARGLRQPIRHGRAISGTMATPMQRETPSPLLTAALTGLTLVGALVGLAKIPGVGIGWSNALVPLGGIGLIFVHHDALVPTFKKYRCLFILGLAFWCWGLIAALAGWDPVRSLRWLIKAGGWALVFVGATVASRDEEHGGALLKTLWLFLVVIALGGVAESVVPGSDFWRLFRTESSLSIQPRVASILGWPNQFGLIMGAGLFLNERLGMTGLLNRPVVTLTRILLITQLAQSGSRNAYLTFAVVLVVAVATKALPWKRGALAAVIFAVTVVLLPVASLQAGLGRVYVPQLEPTLESRTWELSDRRQTLSLRSQLWRQATAEIVRDPVTGIGPDVFQFHVGPRVMDRTGFNAHNLPLQVTVETGFIGLALALAWAFVLFSNRTPGSAALLPLTALAVGQLLDCFVHDPPTMVVCALLCGAVLGVRPVSKETQTSEETDQPRRARSAVGDQPSAETLNVRNPGGRLSTP